MPQGWSLTRELTVVDSGTETVMESQPCAPLAAHVWLFLPKHAPSTNVKGKAKSHLEGGCGPQGRGVTRFDLSRRGTTFPGWGINT